MCRKKSIIKLEWQRCFCRNAKCIYSFLVEKQKKETAFQMFKNSKKKSVENFVDHEKQARSHNRSCH